MSDLLKLRVTSVSWQTDAIRSITLQGQAFETLPAFTAGSHIDIHLPTGISRSYSLTNDQNESYRYVVGVARDRASRGGSAYLHDQLRVGDVLRVRPPRNLFPLREDAPSAVLIVGGIGVTPSVAMARRLDELGRDWTLHYAVRSRAEAAFLGTLARFGDRVRLHCDDERGGHLDIASIVHQAAREAHFYCCGPTPMMQAFAAAVGSVPPARVHVEHFGPVEAAAVDGGFLVELARSGRTLAVPEGSTILEALINARIAVPNSCQQGVCGTCETKVLSGLPDHRDSVLTPQERAANTTMMVCCSGSLSEKLVLDL